MFPGPAAVPNLTSSSHRVPLRTPADQRNPCWGRWLPSVYAQALGRDWAQPMGGTLGNGKTGPTELRVLGGLVSRGGGAGPHHG